MTNTVKKALSLMKTYSPYNEETGNEDAYNVIYNALYTLSCFGIITQDEWKKVYTLDGEMYGESIKAWS